MAVDGERRERRIRGDVDAPACLDGGLIVGTKYPIPADVAEYYRERDMRVGCNRIECSICSSSVKHIDGYSLLQKDLRSRDDHEKLYASPNPTQWSFLRRDPQYRTYFCRCSWAHMFGIKELPYVDSADGWYCAGHSPVSAT